MSELGNEKLGWKYRPVCVAKVATPIELRLLTHAYCDRTLLARDSQISLLTQPPSGRLLEVPTMVVRTSDWREELGRFLKPFLARLGHKARRRMCPLYVSGLIGPGDRKSIQPMAERLALGDYDQLHHFIAAGPEMWRRWRPNCLFPREELLIAVACAHAWSASLQVHGDELPTGTERFRTMGPILKPTSLPGVAMLSLFSRLTPRDAGHAFGGDGTGSAYYAISALGQPRHICPPCVSLTFWRA